MTDEEFEGFSGKFGDRVEHESNNVVAVRIDRSGDDEDGLPYDVVWAIDAPVNSDFIRVFANGRHVCSLIPMRGRDRQAVSILPMLAGDDEGNAQVLVYPHGYTIEMNTFHGVLRDSEGWCSEATYTEEA